MLENKERLTGQPEITEVKRPVLELIEKKTFVPREIKTWLQKVEEAQINSVKDNSGSLILTPVSTQTPQKTLPVSQQKFIYLLSTKIGEASRWLGAFILRLIKMNGGKVKFKEE